MLTRLFRHAVRLYPVDHRTSFGDEMCEVFDHASDAAWKKGVLPGITFCAREATGLLVEAVRLHLALTGGRREHWLWSLEAPALVIALYSLAVVASHDSGTWGFYFPATYVVVATVAGGCAWIAGRAFAIVRTPRRYGALVVAALAATFIVPPMIRAIEDAQARSALKQQAAVSYAIPGIAVDSHAGTVSERGAPGLTFTRIVSGAEGATLTLRQQRNHSSPPYLAIGAIFTGLVAFVSRRRASA